MRSSLTSLTAAAQTVKAQTLSTLMSALNAVQGVSAVAANEADNPQARLQSAEAQVKATIVGVDAQGKASHTAFRLLARWPEASLLEAQLKTGRTHQIRVHLSHLGFPILGDEKYGDFALNKELKRHGLKRMALHAWRMSFHHPLTAAPMACLAPLPDSIAGYLAVLDGKGGREYTAPNYEEILAAS